MALVGLLANLLVSLLCELALRACVVSLLCELALGALFVGLLVSLLCKLAYEIVLALSMAE